MRRGGPSRSRHGRPFAKEMRRLRERESAWDENFARQPKVGLPCAGAGAGSRAHPPSSSPRAQSTAQANLSSPLARASVWLREKPDGRARKNGSRGKDKRSRNLESGWRGVLEGRRAPPAAGRELTPPPRRRH